MNRIIAVLAFCAPQAVVWSNGQVSATHYALELLACFFGGLGAFFIWKSA